MVICQLCSEGLQEPRELISVFSVFSPSFWCPILMLINLKHGGCRRGVSLLWEGTSCTPGRGSSAARWPCCRLAVVEGLVLRCVSLGRNDQDSGSHTALVAVPTWRLLGRCRNCRDIPSQENLCPREWGRGAQLWREVVCRKVCESCMWCIM